MTVLPLGESAALLASICFAIGPTFNTLAGRRLSVMTVNRLRLVITILILFAVHGLLYGELLPQAGLERWAWLALSAIFSVVLGDSLLFAAFARIGTRLSMLLATITPLISAGLAWMWLGERLQPVQLGGGAAALIGVAVVILERRPSEPNAGSHAGGYAAGHASGRAGGQTSSNRVAPVRTPTERAGVWLAVASAACHAIGALAAKQGLAGDFPALSGHLARTLIGLILVWAPLLLRGKLGTLVAEVRANRQALRHVFWGALFGPVLGMWLNLVAIQKIDLGIASALASLPPIWLLPVGRWLFHEKIGPLAVGGSVVAVVGVVVIFLG